MKTIKHWVLLTGVATLMSLNPNPASAQDRQGGRGNFDPEQFRQRMMERYREQLEVKSDEEWKVLETRIEKVMDARREIGALGGPGGFGRGPGGRRGDNGGGAAGGGGRGARAPWGRAAP